MKNQTFNPNITKRTRRRKTRAGQPIEHVRWIVNYRCPDTGKRTQKFFTSKRDAEAFRADILAKAMDGTYVDPGRVPMVSEIINHWLSAREGEVKSSTLASYGIVAKVITGPVLEGTAEERREFAATGKKPHRNAKLLQMLGHVPVNELTTADIRRWHNRVKDEVGRYTANRALSMLKSALSLCEEDYRIRAPAMPTNLARRKSRPKKSLLSPVQVADVLAYANADRERGVYLAFPFLAGTRASEQLGLLWEDVDFDANVIHIRRIQERDGSLSECTKTEAGMRNIPMSPMLRAMLLRWKLICPRLDGELHRVFPGPGRLQPWPLPRIGGGGPLLYQNFRRRYWEPVFKELGLPYVTLHSARHSFISTLQAQGVEVGLVAKLAGHANPNVTLGHYTQAVRGGEDAVVALERAYSGATTAG